MGDDREGLSFAERYDRDRKADTTPLSVRVPESLLADLDDVWEDDRFDTRSAFVREVLRYVADNPGEFSDLGESRPRS